MAAVFLDPRIAAVERWLVVAAVETCQAAAAVAAVFLAAAAAPSSVLPCQFLLTAVEAAALLDACVFALPFDESLPDALVPSHFPNADIRQCLQHFAAAVLESNCWSAAYAE